MCLAVLARGISARFPFVIATNRDEFHARPTALLHWWQPEGSAVPVLGGRDLQAGGTWMGLTAAGRYAFVTNVRQGQPLPPGPPSRGEIVPRWLAADVPPETFSGDIRQRGYQRYNVIAGTLDGATYWGSSQAPTLTAIGPGIAGLSNAAELDPPWPKVRTLKQRVASALSDAADADDLAAHLFQALADHGLARDDELPATGVDLATERMLSAVFIQSPDGRYGTRCSTLLIGERDHAGRQVLHVLERSYALGGAATAQRRARLEPGALPAQAPVTEMQL